MLRDQIQATPEYRELTVQEQAEKRAASPQTTTVGDSLAPVLDWEKGDVEFWLQIAQLVILLLILRELRSDS